MKIGFPLTVRTKQANTLGQPTSVLTAHRDKRGARYLRHFIQSNTPMLILLGGLMGCVLASPTVGVTIEELQEPISNLKDTLFNGWMWVPKIGAAVGGCLLAVYNQSIMPLATGAGVGLGIHFYDLYIKADGALI